jgi:hypothetical protein
MEKRCFIGCKTFDDVEHKDCCYVMFVVLPQATITIIVHYSYTERLPLLLHVHVQSSVHFII